jgi:hypothetical protein
MALTVEEYIDTLCPELAVSPSKDVYLTIAVNSTSQSVFGPHYDYAVALRASHEFVIGEKAIKAPEETGLVTGKSDGRVSIKFWNSINDQTASTFDMTIYGIRLKALIRTLGLRASIGSTSVGL